MRLEERSSVETAGNTALRRNKCKEVRQVFLHEDLYKGEKKAKFWTKKNGEIIGKVRNERSALYFSLPCKRLRNQVVDLRV